MAETDLTTPAGMQELADGVHVLLGAVVVIIGVWFFGLVSLWVTVPGLVGYGVWKEFVYDPTHETPATSGGIPGGIRDFKGYMVGMVMGILLAVLHWSLVTHGLLNAS